ncbi:carbohydrate porin [Paucibacter sp. KBW04]|uniref:carbohydrate porin n=1 Tax=Paucibacter sp. KBW04 TaxID=2153361 RepID=UPI0018CC6668|nr:carbohydrate porin [Paucibacter sp. KBW04]
MKSSTQPLTAVPSGVAPATFSAAFKPLRLACTWTLSMALSTALSGAALAAPAEEEAKPAPPASVQWGGIYKADALHVSKPSQNTWIGHLNLHADADLDKLWGWSDTNFHIEALFNHGGRPNLRIGSSQGVSNIEVAEGAARLYATWIERDFKDSGTRVLFGLYDLNSDFYATEASAQLINPSFGIGVEASQSGRNGPSIFPNLGLGLRMRQAVGTNHYVQGVILDGVPGDPLHPGRTSFKLSSDEGALAVMEFGYQSREGEGEAQVNGPGKWAVGAWAYSRATESRIPNDEQLRRNQGVYGLVQGLLHEGGGSRSLGFARAGLAQRSMNQVDLAFDLGVLVEHPFSNVPSLAKVAPESFTAGLAVARYGRAYRDAQQALGQAQADSEIALELGMRWLFVQELAVQPLVQHIWRPGGRPGEATTLLGLRLEWTFGPH